MIRALASFIMRGRWYAVGIVLLAGIVPLLTGWIGIALIVEVTIALVTLRKGWRDGFFVLAFALLPAIVGFGFVEYSALAYFYVVELLLSFLLAGCLRSLVSWPWTFVAGIFASIASSILVVVLVPDAAEQLTSLHREKFGGPATPEDALENRWTKVSFSAFLAWQLLFESILHLIIARWMQAILYNPGGFKKEFLGMRMSGQVVVGCFIGFLFFALQKSEYQQWANVFAIALIFSGLSIGHCFIEKHRPGAATVVVFYLLLIIGFPLSVGVLMAIAVMDIHLNFRKRFNLMQ